MHWHFLFACFFLTKALIRISYHLVVRSMVLKPKNLASTPALHLLAIWISINHQVLGFNFFICKMDLVKDLPISAFYDDQMRAHLELLQGCVEQGGNYPLSREKRAHVPDLKDSLFFPNIIYLENIEKEMQSGLEWVL